MCGKLRRPDFDGETEFLKALEEAVGELGFVPAVKVVGAEVPVVEVVFEHVIGRDEHRRGDGEDGFLGASTALEAEELGSEVRVLGAGGVTYRTFLSRRRRPRGQGAGRLHFAFLCELRRKKPDLCRRFKSDCRHYL